MSLRKSLRNKVKAIIESPAVEKAVDALAEAVVNEIKPKKKWTKKTK